MERLLEMAKKVCDQAEVYHVEESTDGVSFENAKLKNIESKVQSGVSLRILKDGKMGFAYTKNLLHPEDLLEHALDSLKGEVEAPFDFPLTKEVPQLETYDPSVETLPTSALVEECQRVCDHLASRTKGQINVSAGRAVIRRRILNGHGTDLSTVSSIYSLNTEILYPGSYSAIQRQFVDKKFGKTPQEHLDFSLALYNASAEEARVKGGRMKVLFLPETLYVLIWRLQSATNGKNVYHGVSPLIGKQGEKVFDCQLTVYDDPLNDTLPDARGFDDEATRCQRLLVIDSGKIANFYYDLFYASKLKANPTGHGYKTSLWGGETVSFKPSPSLEHLFVSPGDRSFFELVRMIDRGLIIGGAMGAHSGNIQNGDYSIGLSPGLYVEGGEIVGHVKDAMVAGNIFETMKEIVAIENEIHPAFAGTFPAVLFENISVATKE